MPLGVTDTVVDIIYKAVPGWNIGFTTADESYPLSLGDLDATGIVWVANRLREEYETAIGSCHAGVPVKEAVFDPLFQQHEAGSAMPTVRELRKGILREVHRMAAKLWRSAKSKYPPVSIREITTNPNARWRWLSDATSVYVGQKLKSNGDHRSVFVPSPLDHARRRSPGHLICAENFTGPGWVACVDV